MNMRLENVPVVLNQDLKIKAIRERMTLNNYVIALLKRANKENLEIKEI